MKNTAYIFTITLASSYTFFIFGNTLRVKKVTDIQLRDLFCPKIPENMKKQNIHFPAPETIKYMVEWQQKYLNNINA